MASDFMWNNTAYDNELWHLGSKVIIAQVFKHEKDAAGHQTWKLLLPWHTDPLIFDKRTSAKKWGLEAAKDYAERHFDGVNWTPGNSPAEARVESKARRERVEAKLAAKAAKAAS